MVEAALGAKLGEADGPIKQEDISCLKSVCMTSEHTERRSIGRGSFWGPARRSCGTYRIEQIKKVQSDSKVSKYQDALFITERGSIG